MTFHPILLLCTGLLYIRMYFHYIHIIKSFDNYTGVVQFSRLHNIYDYISRIRGDEKMHDLEIAVNDCDYINNRKDKIV